MVMNDSFLDRRVSDESYSFEYDPKRYDPDQRSEECELCGANLRGAGDGSTVGQHCPNCEKLVWIA